MVSSWRPEVVSEPRVKDDTVNEKRGLGQT